MTPDEAILFLRNYPCVCEYGSTPTDCNDKECPFGEAIRLITKEALKEFHQIAEATDRITEERTFTEEQYREWRREI